MKKIALINVSDCYNIWTYYAAFSEFLQGFTDCNYEVSEVNKLEECKDKDILFLSNQKFLENPNGLEEFFSKLNEINPNAIYILWYFHDVFDKIPFKKFILTSEYHHRLPRIEYHKKAQEFHLSIPNFVPLMLRANESPINIGLNEKTYELNGCFMGCAYKNDWTMGLENIFYHDIARGLIPYNERKKIYLKSKIAFGFSSDNNILNYHPSQRIFEGLTYGCVVISDNEAASELTGGIVVYAPTKEDFLSKYYFYLTHPKEYTEKQSRGYEWAKKFGTNRFAASLFIDKIKELNY